MVQTSVERSNEVWPFWAALMQQFAHG